MVRIVAEVGCNHAGDRDLALRLVALAASSGADVVKFQKRDVETHLDDARLSAPYDSPHSFGATYREHRSRLELTRQDHRALASAATDLGIAYACSVWDVTSLGDVIACTPSFVKIPSASNTNIRLLERVRDVWPGEVAISLGMTTRAEEENILSVFEGSLNRLVLYACTAAYPVASSDLALLEITRLRTAYPELLHVGFSGHHVGVLPDVAAVALGARSIERHFTDDRDRKGSDNAISLLPDDMAELRQAVTAVEEGLTEKPRGILPVERPALLRMKYSGRRRCD